jgi:hypothetical protein
MESAPAPAPDRLRRWFVGPPRRLFLIVLLGTIGLTLAATSAPGWYATPAKLALGAWIGIAAIVAIRGVGRLAILIGWGRDPDRRFVRSLRVWAAVVVMVALTLVAHVTETPMRVGLQLAKGDMLAYAGDPRAVAPRRIGPYPVEQAEHIPGGGAKFIVKGPGILNRYGFAYNRSGPPEKTVPEDEYRHLGGDWYEWSLGGENW